MDAVDCTLCSQRCQWLSLVCCCCCIIGCSQLLYAACYVVLTLPHCFSHGRSLFYLLLRYSLRVVLAQHNYRNCCLFNFDGCVLCSCCCCYWLTVYCSHFALRFVVLNTANCYVYVYACSTPLLFYILFLPIGTIFCVFVHVQRRVDWFYCIKILNNIWLSMHIFTSTKAVWL